jgi:hypothetical protein
MAKCVTKSHLGALPFGAVFQQCGIFLKSLVLSEVEDHMGYWRN